MREIYTMQSEKKITRENALDIKKLLRNTEKNSEKRNLNVRDF